MPELLLWKEHSGKVQVCRLPLFMRMPCITSFSCFCFPVLKPALGSFLRFSRCYHTLSFVTFQSVKTLLATVWESRCLLFFGDIRSSEIVNVNSRTSVIDVIRSGRNHAGLDVAHHEAQHSVGLFSLCSRDERWNSATHVKEKCTSACSGKSKSITHTSHKSSLGEFNGI